MNVDDVDEATPVKYNKLSILQQHRERRKFKDLQQGRDEERLSRELELRSRRRQQQTTLRRRLLMYPRTRNFQRKKKAIECTISKKSESSNSKSFQQHMTAESISPQSYHASKSSVLIDLT